MLRSLGGRLGSGRGFNNRLRGGFNDRFGCGFYNRLGCGLYNRFGLHHNFRCNFFGGRGLHSYGLSYRLGWGIGVQRGYFDNFGGLGVGRGFGQRLLKLRRRF